jgi:hypothetical protein
VRIVSIDLEIINYNIGFSFTSLRFMGLLAAQTTPAARIITIMQSPNKEIIFITSPVIGEHDQHIKITTGK